MEKVLKILLFLAVPTMILGQVISINIQNFNYEISIAEFLIVIVTGLFIADKIFKKDLKIYFPVTIALFASYLFLATISVLWSDDASRTIIALRVGLYHILVLTLATNIIQTKKDIRHLFYFFSIAAILISIQLVYSVYEIGGFFTKFIPSRTSITTPVGPWVTVSAIIVLMLPIIYSLGLLVAKKKKTISKFIFAGTVFAAITSLLTLGKSELTALVVGAVFFHRRYFNYLKQGEAGANISKKTVRAATVLVSVLVISGIVLMPFAIGFANRFKNIFSDDTTGFRKQEYQLTFQAVKENFFTGVGAGNLKVYFRNKGLCQCYTEASSYINQFFGEFGIVGFLLLISGGYSIFRAARMLKGISTQDKIILLSFQTSLIIFLVNGLFETTIFGLNYGIVFWMLIGTLLAFERILKQEQMENSNIKYHYGIN